MIFRLSKNKHAFVLSLLKRRLRYSKAKTLATTQNAIDPEQRISRGQSIISFNPAKTKQSALNLNGNSNTVKGFEDLNLSSEMIIALKDLCVYHPTVIQLGTIPLVFQGSNILCASQTGSGKTLAYLSPIIDMLKAEEANGSVIRPSHPRACILVPSRELATQTLKIVKGICHHVRLRSAGMIGGISESSIRRSFKQPIDIVVSTTGTLLKYKRRGFTVISKATYSSDQDGFPSEGIESWINFTDLQFMVFDEIDTLLDPSFKESTFQIINSLRLGDVNQSIDQREPQCILAGATIPSKGVMDVVHELIPQLKVTKSSLHKVLPHVNHQFEKVSTSEKEVLVKQLLRSKHGPSLTRQCVIFSNSATTSVWLCNQLKESDFDAICLHGNMSLEERSLVYEKFAEGSHCILVATDIASRGLDMPKVGVVVNYDCPTNETDYLHRAGRTGRMFGTHTGKPVVYTYITKNKDARLAKKIQTAAMKNISLNEIHLKGQKTLTKS